MDYLRTLAETDGFFTRAQAFDAGHDDRSLQREIRSRRWARVRPGAYTMADLWSAQDELGRYKIRGRAALVRLGPRVALSHTSAAAEHGLDLWGVDLSRVHVTRLDGGAGRTEAGVQHHETLLLPADLVETPYGLVTAPPRAALETAALHDTEVAVVVLDALLRKKLATPDELAAAVALMRSWPGTLHLQVAVRLADGRAGSVGESRGRYVCFAWRLPAPDLQFHVFDGQGRLIGITDFAWPDLRMLGEFDGRVKYGRLLKPGEEPGDAVFREKRREDALRAATNFGMIRLVWADLATPAATAARMRRRLLGDAAA